MKVKQFLIDDRTVVWIIIITLLFQSLNFAYGSISFGILAFACFFRILNGKFQFKIYILYPIIFYAFMTLSLLWTEDISSTLNTLKRLSPLLLIPATIGFSVNLCQDYFVKIFKFYSYLYSVIALIFILIGCINYLETGETKYLFYHTLVQSAHLNAIYASSFAFIAYAWLILEKHLSLIKFICLSILLVFILLLSSKIIILLTLLLSIFSIIRKSTYKLKLLVIVSIILLPIIYQIGSSKSIFQRISTEKKTNIKEVLNCKNFTKVYPWTGLALRVFQGRVAYEIIEKKPSILGYGLGLNASEASITQVHKKYNLYPGFYKYNFHNQYLQTIVELGVIGLILLIVCLFQFLKHYLRNKNLFLLLIFILFITLFLTESYLMRQRGVIFFSIIYSILHFNNYKKTESL